MDEYIVTVLMDGDKKPTELKNFGSCPEEVIDNLVQIKGIKYLYHLKRIKDNEIWDFESDLEPLREIRKLVMDSDGQVGLELKVVEDDEKDNSELH